MKKTTRYRQIGVSGLHCDHQSMVKQRCRFGLIGAVNQSVIDESMLPMISLDPLYLCSDRSQKLH
ncbi:MAG: hypothetical protein OXC63_12340 [Aestuariivita sp.]|nr:hypothetical protein [Aestuariivita sp.]